MQEPEHKKTSRYKQNSPHKQFVNALREELDSNRVMFRKLYGKKEENYGEVQKLINYMNRGTYNIEFIILLIRAFELENVTMGEFFLGKVQNQNEQSNEQKSKG